MRLSKILFVIAGCLLVVLGGIGIFLPLLPATPFLLAASFCFLKGSSRLHRWLTGHPVLGPRLERFKKEGLTKKEKIGIYVLAFAMILPIIILSRSLHLRIFLAVLLVTKAVVFMRIRTAPPAEKPVPAAGNPETPAGEPVRPAVSTST